MADTFNCFIDNEPAMYERKKGLFWSRRTGVLLGDKELALTNRHFALDKVVTIGGVPYYEGKWSFGRVGNPADELALHEVEEKNAKGAVVERPEGSAFREAMRKEWKGLWKAGTREYEEFDGRKLEFVYVDNEPCLHDVKEGCYRLVDDYGGMTDAALKDAGMTVSRLRIGLVGGKPYYVPDNVREMCRVGRPSERATFEALDMLWGEYWGLAFPGGRVLKEALQKEMALDPDLPLVTLNGRQYQSDERFRECRAVDNRMDVILWDDIEAYPHSYMHGRRRAPGLRRREAERERG